MQKNTDRPSTDHRPSGPPAVDLESYLRVHRLLRSSAEQLAVGLTRPGHGPSRARWITGFTGEIRCHHHIEDELLFPALAARVVTFDEVGPTLAGDHADLDVVLDDLDAAARAHDWVTAAGLARHLSDHLHDHLDFEDREIVGMFARHFTSEEFEALNVSAIKMVPPRQLLFTVPWTMSLLGPDEQQTVLSSAPGFMRLLWIVLAWWLRPTDRPGARRCAMSIDALRDTNVTRHHAYLEAFNERDFDTVRSLLHPDIVDHHLPPDVPPGADGVVGFLQLLAQAFDIHVTVVQVVDAGDIVAVSGRIRGVHVGDFPGMPATHRPFDVAITSVERFEAGVIVERWEQFDEAAMTAQLAG